MVDYEGITAKTLDDHICDDDLAHTLSWFVVVGTDGVLAVVDHAFKIEQIEQGDIYHFVGVLAELLMGKILIWSNVLWSRLEWTARLGTWTVVWMCVAVEVLMWVGKLFEKCFACSSMDRLTMKEIVFEA
ncbi:leucine-rich repeat protein kinase family protein [Striga asiatica]|uniref:Leucine-rich repeat protein kinase family protein n=1 Tax=Striga asiatica TaxID=4170 RepID=A0A5A7Q4X9_STRAF|nr:leucine-rich repeat protein kinase family protein [Striga asiatica]